MTPAPLPSASAFVVRASFRVPGLGLLVLPALPVPAWLATPALHTAVQVQLYGLTTVLLSATIEELAHDGQPPTRALLLDADLGAPAAGSWLELVRVVPQELW